MDPSEISEYGGPAGSFYHLNLELLSEAHPEKSPEWHRQQARDALDAVIDQDLPASYPRTEEDLEALARDFDISLAKWQAATTSGSEGAVEVAKVNGLVGIRKRNDPRIPVLVFTVHEWRAFAVGIRSGDFNFDFAGPIRGPILREWLPKAHNRKQFMSVADRVVAS